MTCRSVQVPVVVTHPQHVVAWEWEVVRGEVEFTLLRPTGSTEGAGVEAGGVEGYERLQEPQLGKPGEAIQVSNLTHGHFICSHAYTCSCVTAGKLRVFQCGASGLALGSIPPSHYRHLHVLLRDHWDTGPQVDPT